MIRDRDGYAYDHDLFGRTSTRKPSKVMYGAFVDKHGKPLSKETAEWLEESEREIQEFFAEFSKEENS